MKRQYSVIQSASSIVKIHQSCRQQILLLGDSIVKDTFVTEKKVLKSNFRKIKREQIAEGL